MKAEFYNKVYLKNTLDLLKDDLEDLAKWSVYNDDEYNEEISEIKERIDLMLEESKE